MKRRNILLSLAAFPTLAVAHPLLPLEKLVEPVYTIYFTLDDSKNEVTIYSGTKEEIKEQLFRPYRASYCQGRKVKFLMHEGKLKKADLNSSCKEICHYLWDKKYLSEKLSFKFVRGVVGEFRESVINDILDRCCSVLNKKNSC